MSNELATVNDTAIATQTENADTMFLPQNQEQFEMIKELQASDAELNQVLMTSVSSQELMRAGAVFNVLDVFNTTILDKDEEKAVTVFQIEFVEDVKTEKNTFVAGEIVSVMKSANTINGKIANAFANWKAVGKPKTLCNYQFVEDLRYQRNGNAAIVLRAAPKQIKAVNSKK